MAENKPDSEPKPEEAEATTADAQAAHSPEAGDEAVVESPEAGAFVDEIDKGLDGSPAPVADEFVDQIDRSVGIGGSPEADAFVDQIDHDDDAPDAAMLLDDIDLTRPNPGDAVATSQTNADSDD